LALFDLIWVGQEVEEGDLVREHVSEDDRDLALPQKLKQ
jgi:hypothetical protein